MGRSTSRSIAMKKMWHEKREEARVRIVQREVKPRVDDVEQAVLALKEAITKEITKRMVEHFTNGRIS